MAAVALKNFFVGMSGKKFGEIPAYIQNSVNWAEIQAKATQSFVAYKTANLDSGSSLPLKHLLGYGMLFGYVVSWPTEYAHYKAEQAAKLKGEAAH